MSFFTRALGVTAVFAAGLLAISYLRHRFDDGDVKRALEVTRDFIPSGGEKTLNRLMAEAGGTGEGDVRCEARLASRYEGLVAVTCRVANRTFRYEVALIGAGIRALDDGTRVLFTEKKP